jgi:hypothetical protein
MLGENPREGRLSAAGSNVCCETLQGAHEFSVLSQGICLKARHAAAEVRLLQFIDGPCRARQEATGEWAEGYERHA